MMQGQGIQKATLSIVTPASGCLSLAKLMFQGINRTNPGDTISPETEQRFGKIPEIRKSPVYYQDSLSPY